MKDVKGWEYGNVYHNDKWVFLYDPLPTIADYLLTGLAQNSQVRKAYICRNSCQGRKTRNYLNPGSSKNVEI